MKKPLKTLITIIVAGGLFSLIYFLNPFHINSSANSVLAVMSLMLTLWFSETLPVGVVALFPLALFPLLNIMPISGAIENYYHKIVGLFFGGFVIGLAVEKWNLHKRIALGIVKITGTSPNRIILGFAIAVSFLSMWLSNTATTMMMFPIAASIIALVNANYSGDGKTRNFGLVLMLIIAYAANVGGMSTLIGTPPNVVLRGVMTKEFGYTINFLPWMLMALPLAIIMIGITYVLLTFVLYPNRMKKDSIPKSLINDEYKKLGKMSRQEWIVAIIFIQTCLLWILRIQVNQLLELMEINFKLNDTYIALWGAALMFLTPAKIKSYKWIFTWKDLKKMQWGILLLFGGGLCLAKGMENSGLMQLVGDWGAAKAGNRELLMIFLLTFIAIFLTEVMSNVALVSVFIPIVGSIALAMPVNPLLFTIPVTLGASCAFMSPIGTPPNAIVYASRQIKLYQMATAGVILNVIAGLIVAMASYFLIAAIFV